MASVAKQIEDAVKDAINGGSYTETFVATVEPIPDSELANGLTNLKVFVVPGSLTAQTSDRKSAIANYAVDVSVSQQCTPTDATKIESLRLTVEEIQDVLMADANRNLSGVATWIPPFINDPQFDQSLLRKNKVFLSITTFTYRVYRDF